MSMMGSSRYEFDTGLFDKDVEKKRMYVEGRSKKAKEIIRDFIFEDAELINENFAILLEQARYTADEIGYFESKSVGINITRYADAYDAQMKKTPDKAP